MYWEIECLNKKAKQQFILNLLEEFYPAPSIPLTHTSPYTLLVAVVLSARSTDAMVNRVTPLLFSKADSPSKMSKLEEEEIRQIIKPVGLSPKKAKALKGLSLILMEQFEGKVPASFEALEKLPGVGHKTASVVLSQAFHQPAFPVDTHIYRLAHRWGITTQKSIKRVEEDLKKFFPKKSWIKVHLQMIYYGRSFCPARGHKPEKCPICKGLK